MAMIKCNECGAEVSTNAKACQKCGAPPRKRMHIGRVLLYGFLAFVVISVVGRMAAPGSSSISVSSAAAPSKSPHEAALDSLKLDYKWGTGGFDSIMLLSGSITNSGAASVKDLVIECTGTANSGTVIDHNKHTLHERIEAGKTLKFKDFNMGFLNSQVKTSSCGIVDFAT